MLSHRAGQSRAGQSEVTLSEEHENDLDQLGRLQPELIGVLFGRRSAPVPLTMIGDVRAKFRFLAIAIAAPVVLLIASVHSKVLVGNGTITALSALAQPPRVITSVKMALIQDPVAITVVIAALFTPIICAEQVEAIREYIPMNLNNYLARPLVLRAQRIEVARINSYIRRANRYFSAIGNRYVSLIFLAFGAGLSYLIYRVIRVDGLLQSWNSTSLASRVWSQKVYDGWWANSDRHFLMALALCAISTYLFYFLQKQLLMGAVFAFFAHTMTKLEFGIVPNMDYNSDGYWGLRPLRRFMLWTFSATVTDFVATLGVFVVWLPFTQWTVALAAGVMLANTVVVFYPSWLAYRSSVSSKVRYAAEIAASNVLFQEEKDKYFDRIWSNPHLPFRLRNAITGVTLYFLIPLVLAVVSALLTHGS